MEKEKEKDEAENMKKEEMEVEEDGLSKGWKLFNVIMVGIAFMLIFTGTRQTENFKNLKILI